MTFITTVPLVSQPSFPVQNPLHIHNENPPPPELRNPVPVLIEDPIVEEEAFLLESEPEQPLYVESSLYLTTIQQESVLCVDTSIFVSSKEEETPQDVQPS